MAPTLAIATSEGTGRVMSVNPTADKISTEDNRLIVHCIGEMCQIVGLPKRLIRLISSDVDNSWSRRSIVTLIHDFTYISLAYDSVFIFISNTTSHKCVCACAWASACVCVCCL